MESLDYLPKTSLMPVMTTLQERFYIPKCLENWPWPRRINPHYTECKIASGAWAASFGAFSPKAQYAYDRCDFNLLASLAYPLETKERCRTGCDLMNMFFVFDEWSDASPPDEVAKQAAIIMDALRNPHTPRPKDEWVGGEVTGQFWELAIETATPGSQKRFIDTFDQYTQAVVQQAKDRDHKYVRDIQSYLEVRRNTIGAKPSFVVLEMDLELPDEVLQHPVILKLADYSIDMICLGNDIASYNLEQARGDDYHNIVRIAMNQLNTDIAGAMEWVVKYHAELECDFLDLYNNGVPSFGEEIDYQVQRYVWGLGNWVRASDQWGFESERYFGKMAPEIFKRRWVNLMKPKDEPKDIGPVLVDGSVL